MVMTSPGTIRKLGSYWRASKSFLAAFISFIVEGSGWGILNWQ